jgi:hypothetical protein
MHVLQCTLQCYRQLGSSLIAHDRSPEVSTAGALHACLASKQLTSTVLLQGRLANRQQLLLPDLQVCQIDASLISPEVYGCSPTWAMLGNGIDSRGTLRPASFFQRGPLVTASQRGARSKNLRPMAMQCHRLPNNCQPLARATVRHCSSVAQHANAIRPVGFIMFNPKQ